MIYNTTGYNYRRYKKVVEDQGNEVRAKLKEVFKLLRKKGLVARMNFSCCQGCATGQLSEDLKKHPEKKGYVYYHNQDNEELSKTGKVYLAFGSANDSTQEDGAIGNMIAVTLFNAGLHVDWDGNTEHRIYVKGV